MALRFRDRFFSPPVGRAIISPLGLALAGGGFAVGWLAGLPVVGAAAVGLGAWAARVALAIPRRRRRRRRRDRIDPFTVSEPWRHYVQGALAAQARFGRTVDSMRAGPLRDRLASIGERIADAVGEVWQIASGGHTIDRGLTTLDTRGARLALAELEAADPLDAHTHATVSSLEAQLATASRMEQVSADARNQLRLLDARLDELVARAVELSVGGSTAGVGGLGDDVDVLVQEMEALRQAVEEIDQVARPGLPPSTPPESGTPPG
jgi:hypothetical protein